MKFNAKRIFKFLLLGLLTLVFIGAVFYSLEYMHWKTKSQGYPALYIIQDEYPFEPVTDSLLNRIRWNKLAEDASNDGDILNWPDAKELFVGRSKDTIWFKYALHNNIDINEPMVSIAFEDKENGKEWYGAIKDFKYGAMVSVGYVRKGAKYFGYNFVGKKKGVCKLYYHLNQNYLILSISVESLEPYKDKNFVASIGTKGYWNDDFEIVKNKMLHASINN